MSPLSILVNLRTIDISNNKINDISPLWNLPNLTSLDFQGNPLPPYIYQQALYEDYILSTLFPYINEAIKQYYGEDRQFMNAGILDIKKEFGYYELKVRITTFVGAHNPPYGLDTMTIVKDRSEIYVKDYIHEEME